ncbi:BQ2448_4841 [Microbotryum intermedium]|uniref:THO complex subunit 2 n=1 Tax=Microbotryum intermedium TaxID=269621 RepID=A0A238FFY5_9BASI|nr:BQ2448_4841 [Microbotryum intermedium]
MDTQVDLPVSRRELYELVRLWYLDPASATVALTNALVTVFAASTPRASTSDAVDLLTSLHSLLLPLCSIEATLATADTLANYLIHSLHPELAPEHYLRFSDVIIDVAWQFEQAIDNGCLPNAALPTSATIAVAAAATGTAAEAAPTTDDANDQMQIDLDDLKVVEDAASIAQSLQRKRARQVQQARENVGSLLKQLCTANIISVDAVGERLDLVSLVVPTLGIISNVQHFQRHEIRSRTALYYKQQKFNLLREEMEGYSKLAVELLLLPGPPQSTEDGRSVESEEQRFKRANAAMDKVKSLIGNFDLDPDRTIDLILDAFTEQVIDHYQFYLDLISVSPWASSCKKNGAASPEKGKAKQTDIDIGLEEDQGNRVLAQILGFKFKFYQTEGVGETPRQLYLMTALLIWHGLVKLSDLWPHLSPDDSVLSKVESQYREDQEKAAASVGGGNALAMAGALVDDDAPTAKPTMSTASNANGDAAAAAAKPGHVLPNQRLGLIKAMLSLGDLAHALFVLSQYPALVFANLEVAALLNRLVVVSLTPAFDAIDSLSLKTDASRRAELKAPRRVFESSTKTLVPPPPKGRVLTSRAIPLPIPNKEQFFFFPDWQTRLPKCGDAEEVLVVLEKTFAPLLGPFLALDLPAYSRICRIIKQDFSKVAPAENPRFARWLVLIRQVLLPGAALLKDNSPVGLLIWDVLRLLTIEQRYQLYGEWKDAMYRRIPVLGVRKAETEREVKMILRRLSTENVKRLGKNLAKAAHNNPIITFAVVLNQVQSYDNLILPVVESARYLSDLSYDVLTYTVLDALSSSKSKTKEDGTSIALWLQSLATFTGHLYRRWSALEPSLAMVLQYLVNQLVSGNSKDLIILREIISKMTGIEPFADLSDAQVFALAGGKVLRSEVFFQTEIGQAAKSKEMALTNNSRDRLGKVLERTRLSMPLLVNIALQRQACVAMDTHLKSLGALFDSNHAILFQFTELLLALMDLTELAKELPTIEELTRDYGIEPAVAFEIGRPKLRIAMKAFDESDAARNQELEKRKADLRAKLAKEKLSKASEEAAKTTTAAAAVPPVEGGESKVEAMKKEAASEEEKVEAGIPTEDTKMEDAAAKSVEEVKALVADAAMDVLMTDGTATDPPGSPVIKAPTWHPGLVDVIQATEATLPSEVQEVMGAPFYVTFWQLTLYDIMYPKERYDAELDRLNKMQRDISGSEIAQTLTKEATSRFVQNIVSLANKMLKEAEEHRSARAVVSRRLTREAKSWFIDVITNSQRKVLIDQIVQYCIHPRVKLSLPDAVFSYQFIKRLHSMNTTGFHSILIYDRVLNRHLVPVIYSCSENEARNYARFLHDMLQDVNNWYRSEDKFKSEAIGSGLSGFARRPAAQFSSTIKFEDCFSHKDFQLVTEKWTNRTISSFSEGFESGNYMHIKNSILVLTKIAPHFPIEYKSGIRLEAAIEALLKTEQREDLKILAQGYKAVIAKRKKHWANQPALPAPPAAPVVEIKSIASSSAPSSSRQSPAPSSVPARTQASDAPPAGPASLRATATSFSGLPMRPSLSSGGARDPLRPAPSDIRPARDVAARDADRFADPNRLRSDLISRLNPSNGGRSDAPAARGDQPTPAPPRPDATPRPQPAPRSDHTPAPSASQSAVTSNGNENGNGNGNGLPARPGSSESELRAKALASSRNSTLMKPPATTSSAAGTPRARSPAPTGPAASIVQPTTQPAQDTSRAPSRPATPREQDRGRDREDHSSRRRSSRERSVESTRSSNSKRETRSSARDEPSSRPSRSDRNDESRSTRDAGRDKKTDSDREGTRDRDRRDRDRDRDHRRERERERDGDKHRSHESSSRSSRRSGGDRSAAEEDRRRNERKDEEHRKTESRRDDDRKVDDRKVDDRRFDDKKVEDRNVDDDKTRGEDKKRDSDGRRHSHNHDERESRRRGEDREKEVSPPWSSTLMGPLIADGAMIDSQLPARDSGSTSRQPSPGRSLADRLKPAAADDSKRAPPQGRNERDDDHNKGDRDRERTREEPNVPKSPTEPTRVSVRSTASKESESSKPPTAPFSIRGSSSGASRLMSSAGLTSRSEPTSSRRSSKGATRDGEHDEKRDDMIDSRKRAGGERVEELEVKRARTSAPVAPPVAPAGVRDRDRAGRDSRSSRVVRDTWDNNRGPRGPEAAPPPTRDSHHSLRLREEGDNLYPTRCMRNDLCAMLKSTPEEFWCMTLPL